MTQIKCIVYGKSKFCPSKFDPIKNRAWIKPKGGLWSSPIDSKWGWKDWCESEEFNIEKLSEFFEFTFKGKLLKIDSIEDASKLPWIKHPGFELSFFLSASPDYEKIVKEYDGILLTEKGENQTRFAKGHSFYGWDCETVLIMNPSSIIE